jgi:hypothetical protein
MTEKLLNDELNSHGAYSVSPKRNAEKCPLNKQLNAGID